MTKRECIKTARMMHRALTGISREDFLQLNPDVRKNRTSEDEPHVLTFRGMTFTIRFEENGKNGRLDNEFVLPDSHELYNTSECTGCEDRYYPKADMRFGNKKYAYSIRDLEAAFASEPFILGHLTKRDLRWYAYAVKTEMEDYDRLVREGTITQDVRDEKLSLTEERILASIAPYRSDINNMEEYMKLFLKDMPKTASKGKAGTPPALTVKETFEARFKRLKEEAIAEAKRRLSAQPCKEFILETPVTMTVTKPEHNTCTLRADSVLLKDGLLTINGTDVWKGAAWRRTGTCSSESWTPSRQSDAMPLPSLKRNSTQTRTRLSRAAPDGTPLRVRAGMLIHSRNGAEDRAAVRV